MTTTLETPRELVQSLAQFHLPSKIDAKLQTLMDRNNDGQLTPPELEELESLVELSETISLLRARALHLLSKAPQ
jgi:hypothetical protein